MKRDFNEILSFVKEKKTYFRIGIIALCILIAIGTFIFDKKDEGIIVSGSGGAEADRSDDQSITNEDGYDWDMGMLYGAETIFIDVEGYVNNPGVVSLPEGSRIFHAIDAAGGLAEDGDATFLNLAETLTDGDKLYVPQLGIYDELIAQGEDIDFSGIGIITNGSGGNGGNAGKNAGKININTATSQELQQLSGIGNSIAQKIIDYRTKNGKFGSVEELTLVNGIGDKLLQKIIDDICV